VQEYANIFQKPLLGSSGQKVFPNAFFSRESMSTFCNKCERETITEVEKEWGPGNNCCCL
jgi:hypothetical protein